MHVELLLLITTSVNSFVSTLLFLLVITYYLFVIGISSLRNIVINRNKTILICLK